jgi:hypothetical protein
MQTTLTKDQINMTNKINATERLEYLRTELRAERISYSELAELQSLAQYIEAGDVELLEAAGVPEYPEVKCICSCGNEHVTSEA